MAVKPMIRGEMMSSIVVLSLADGLIGFFDGAQRSFFRGGDGLNGGETVRRESLSVSISPTDDAFSGAGYMPVTVIQLM